MEKRAIRISIIIYGFAKTGLKNYNFFDKYARIIPDDSSGIYHRYSCEELNRNAKFWIYNIYLVDDKASPCQKCCGEIYEED